MNLRALTTLSILASALAIPNPAFAWKQTPGQGGGISWPSPCFQYSVHQDGSEEIPWQTVVEIVRLSFDAWEDVICASFSFNETAPASVERAEFNIDRGNANLIVWRERDWDEVIDGKLVERSPGIIALTSVMYDQNTNEILDADIELNGVYHSFGALADDPGETQLMDLQGVLTHEIGHTVGLDHSSVPGAVMAPYGGPGDTSKRYLTDDDIDGLCTLYPEGDEVSKCELPYCGLDLSGTSTNCVQSEVDSDHDSGCRAAPQGARLSLVSFAAALLL